MSPSAIDCAVAAGTDWLVQAQHPTGEFPGYSRQLDGDPTWEPDSLNFITALTALGLYGVDGEAAAGLRARARNYLLSQKEPRDLWRYWSHDSPLHDYTPLDADDTACCSMAVGLTDTSRNVNLLLANRAPDGRFYTWFLRRPRGIGLGYRLALRQEWTATVQGRREELWANSQASPNDIDVTVNANVIRYLGPKLAPREAVAWIVDVIEAGTEIVDDNWYHSTTSLYRAVAASAQDGVEEFAALAGVITERITNDPGPDALRNDLELADAVRVLRIFDASPRAIAEMAERLLARQHGDGSWERSICYYGGPEETFGWASEALTTASAVGALAGLKLS